MTERLPAYLAGALICLGLLVIFHLVWKNAHRTIRYILGAGAICAGCTVAGIILDNADLAFGPWIVAFMGLAIALWTWLEERIEKGKQSAQENGELIGMAQWQIRDLKERGGNDAQARPGMDETRSRN